MREISEYSSGSQIARVLTESWFAEYGYCPACTNDQLVTAKANARAKDFQCAVCRHTFELKSTLKPFGRTIPDGAYDSMIERTQAEDSPSLFIMQYSRPMAVHALQLIHRSLLLPAVIERRNPLSPTAKRAGWTGCKILLHAIPPEGRISLVEEGRRRPKHAVRSLFQAVNRLSPNLDQRKWSSSLLSCLHRLQEPTFSLATVYTFEAELAKLFPANHHIRPKIRQQLQVLRDAGLVLFQGNGQYRLLSSTKEAQ